MQGSAEQIADEILVLDAQDGRGGALELLVSRWQKRLWWHAYRLTGSADAAWDITQESWLSIVRSLRRLRQPARFGAWAYRIVSYKAYDWRLKRGRGCPEWESLEGPVPEADPGQPEAIRDVQDILRRLSAGAQALLNLRYLEGFDLAEIAEMLRLPEGTVKSRLHAARNEFKQRWERLSAAPGSATGKEMQNE
jgi:RNA polymerase sigma-70 factor, ECF subfamily